MVNILSPHINLMIQLGRSFISTKIMLIPEQELMNQLKQRLTMREVRRFTVARGNMCICEYMASRKIMSL